MPIAGDGTNRNAMIDDNREEKRIVSVRLPFLRYLHRATGSLYLPLSPIRERQLDERLACRCVLWDVHGASKCAAVSRFERRAQLDWGPARLLGKQCQGDQRTDVVWNE